MTSRPRGRRRRSSGRYTGVWRGAPTTTETGEQSVTQHGSRDGGFNSWRLVSFFIILILAALLALFFVSDVFYVRSISVGGLHYLTKEEVFAYADVANIHLFWLNPDTIRQNVLRSVAIADARVILSWPPNMVQIIVDEREPVLVWEQEGVARWVDSRGRMITQREDRPDLIRVSADTNALEAPLDNSETLDLDIVLGALQLHQLLPEVGVLRYHPTKGLGYKNENGWDVWFGTGTDMAQKVIVYRKIADNLRARGVQPGEIDITNPHAPVYNVLWGR